MSTKMKIAVFGRKFDQCFGPGLKLFIEKLNKYGAEIHIYKPFSEFLLDNNDINFSKKHFFNDHAQITPDFNFFFSLGGDGTFLDAVTYVRNKGIPIIGINTGRLGFLANIAQEEISGSIDCLMSGNFSIEERSLIQFNAPENPFSDFPYALNDITVQKKDSSLITIDALVDGQELNKYWTDGLITSTPTGSTAYSLSTGGPIVAPDCKALIISPIASHNLTVRPMVITDDREITLKIHSRSGHFMVTLDSRPNEFKSGTEIRLKIANFKVKIARLPNHTFFETIRKKLMWGVDIRN
jgi:NAD+ kinase